MSAGSQVLAEVLTWPTDIFANYSICYMICGKLHEPVEDFHLVL